ncbi:hypothetical protein ACQB6R_05420 [Propionibacteriaceae bacterium G1746]
MSNQDNQWGQDNPWGRNNNSSWDAGENSSPWEANNPGNAGQGNVGQGNGNSSWGQPAQSWDQPAQSWEQPAQSWDQQYPSQPQQPQAMQSYPAYGGYQPAAGGYYAMAPEQPSTLGRTAFILTLLALVISMVISYFCGQAYGTLFEGLGTTDFDPNTVPPGLEDEVTRAGLLVMAQGLPTILGITGLIMGFVALGKATASKAFAGWAIAIGFAAPVISFIFWIAVLMPYIPMQ